VSFDEHLFGTKTDSGKWNATRDKSLAAMFVFVFSFPLDARAIRTFSLRAKKLYNATLNVNWESLLLQGSTSF